MASINKLAFQSAEKARDAIMVSQQKQIANLYKEWAKEIGARADYYSRKSNATAWIFERQMKELQGVLRRQSQQVSNEVKGLVQSNMYMMADKVIAANTNWLAKFGFKPFKEGMISASFTSVPDQVVRRLVTGQIYSGGWSLSKSIWGSNEKTLQELYTVVAKGLAANMPTYDIAKELEAYVKPGAKLPWNLTAAQGGKIYKKQVDYNAQRLARTLVQHSYQQSFIAVTKDNPFIKAYRWIANGSRCCEFCAGMNGQVFKKDELPMDHPNGMCIMEPICDTDADITKKLADWVSEPDGTYPEIDAFAKNFGYVAKEKVSVANKLSKSMTVRDVKQNYGHLATSKGLNTWLQKLPDDVKTEVKALKAKSGKSWDQFYQQDIFPGGQAAFDAKFGSKAMSFDSAYEAYYQKLLDSTKDGMYLGKMSKDKFLGMLSASDKVKIGDVDDFVSKAFNKLGKKSGNKVSGAVKSKAEIAAEEKAKNIAAEKAAKEAEKKAAELAKAQAAAKEAAKKIGLDEFSASKWLDVVDGNRHLRKEFEAASDTFWKSLTDAEQKAMNRYTGSGYRNMNRYLRGLSKPDSGTKTACDTLKKALERASLPEATVVRRGSDHNMLEALGIDITEANKDKLVGSIVIDQGFMSTSPFRSGGFSSSIEYIIELPKGSQATYVGRHSVYPSEDELLINCGGNYMVRDVEFSSGGRVRKIYLTLINLQSK